LEEAENDRVAYVKKFINPITTNEIKLMYQYYIYMEYIW